MIPQSRLPQVSALVLGDLDNDGVLDAVIAYEVGINQAFLGRGDGTFVEVVGALGPAQNNTLAIALGDVDGDQILDVVIGNNAVCGWYGVATNELWKGDGTGRFVLVEDAVVGRMPANTSNGEGARTQALALADLNGDGCQAWMEPE